MLSVAACKVTIFRNTPLHSHEVLPAKQPSIYTHCFKHFAMPVLWAKSSMPEPNGIGAHISPMVLEITVAICYILTCRHFNKTKSKEKITMERTSLSARFLGSRKPWLPEGDLVSQRK
jgi:hypothetical protein